MSDKLAFSEFLDKVNDRITQRAREEHTNGLLRVGNVWRLNRMEATIVQDPSNNGAMQLRFKGGADASRYYDGTIGMADPTGDEIFEKLQLLRR